MKQQFITRKPFKAKPIHTNSKKGHRHSDIKSLAIHKITTTLYQKISESTQHQVTLQLHQLKTCKLHHLKTEIQQNISSNPEKQRTQNIRHHPTPIYYFHHYTLLLLNCLQKNSTPLAHTECQSQLMT